MEGIPFYILKKGNSVAGSILIKVSMSGNLAKVYHNVLLREIRIGMCLSRVIMKR